MSQDAATDPAPMVTVIVPSYNGARLLPRALDSVLAQTFQDFEIFISDDGSTDNTRDVVKPYLEDPRIRYHYEENGGLSAARNRAIRRARGKYVFMLDSDDTIPPNSLKRQVEVVEREGTQWARIGINRIEGDTARVVYSEIPADNAAEYALEHGMWGSAFFYRRDALEKAGMYNESIRIIEDIDLDIRLMLAGIPFSAIPEPLYDYWIQPQSLVKGAGSARRLKGLERYYRTYQKPMARRNLAVRKAYAVNMAGLAWAYRREGAGWYPVLRAVYEAVWADPVKPFRAAYRLTRSKR